ncbi:MAG: hypothetical protein LBG89_01865 [Rickettsiales bacterium]|jgi:hypothetical protein|nr:hypothetical protein [Rickettsiales bacterium]
MQEDIQNFSDFADVRAALDGKKRRIEEVLNKTIIVRGQKIIPSKTNDQTMCLHLQFEMDGEKCILFTGSAVLIDQCKKYAEKIPFRATIKKIDKYFTFS